MMIGHQTLADVLVGEGFLLTALEFHVELCERGKELNSLKEFFQDSNNFDKFIRKSEIPPSPCPSFNSDSRIKHRADSQATLDDLSLLEVTRFSDDSHALSGDKVAVLEFELRKAQDTIATLRSQLTVQANKSKEANSREELKALVEKDNDDDDAVDDESEENEIETHEQKILNFLVNEYLLQHGYKLSAITFSDENSNEDFEDWDSIGLNTSKPPSLLRLYRGNPVIAAAVAQKEAIDTCSVECQVFADEMDLEFVHKVQVSQWEEITAKYEMLLISHEKRETEIITANCIIEELNRQIAQLQAQNEARESAPIVDRTKEHIQRELCLLSIPVAFQGYIRGFMPDIDDHAEFHKNDSSDYEVNSILKELLQVLEDTLPSIVSNVILAKRDELIPLLLATINSHGDLNVRDKLLNILFNLIKRPDATQRKLILGGFVAMAKRFGSERIEAEILPQIWEQIDHKYDERRLLVAETCGLLVPYVPSKLRSSLLLSILQQQALEDRDLLVRSAAIVSLGVLVMHFGKEDGEKFEPLWKLTTALLKDSHEQIVSRCQETLLVSVANFGLRHVKLNAMISDLMNDLNSHCQISEDSESLHLLSSRISSLRTLLPFVILSVIQSCPQLDQARVSNNESHPSESPNFNFEILAGSKTEADAMLSSLREILSREWFETWSQLQWFSDFFLAHFCDSVRLITYDKSDTKLIPVIDKLVSVMELIQDYFGKTYALKCLEPILLEHIKEDEKEGESVLYLVLILGLLRHVQPPAAVCTHLQNWIQQRKYDSALFIAERLKDQNDYTDDLAETSWLSVVHENEQRKCFAARLLNLLSTNYHLNSTARESTMSSKILPGLVTLSSDPNEYVRMAAMPGLAQVIISAKSDGLREKSCLQFVSYFEPEQSHLTYLNAIQEVSKVWKEFPSRFREDVLMPRVCDIFAKYGSDETLYKFTSEIQRTEMATSMFELCAIITNSPLTVQSVRNFLSPCVQKVLKDVKELVPALAAEVEKLIHKIEEIYGTIIGNHMVTSVSDNHEESSAKNDSRMANISDVKQRMEKFLKPQAQFWKK